MQPFGENSLPPVKRLIYDDSVRAKINQGDMLLWRGNYLISKIFRRVWGSYYTHVAVVAKWGKRLMVLHSVWPAIEAVPLSRTVREYKGRVDLYWLRDPEHEGKPEDDWQPRVDEVIDDAKSHLGQPFNIWCVIVNGLARLFRFIRIKIRIKQLDPINPTKFFCSQYVAHCFDEYELDLAPDIEDIVTWPQDIADSRYLKLAGTLEPDPGAPSGVTLRQVLWEALPRLSKRASKR